VEISRIEAENYRNIQKMELIPSPGVNIIYGDNGQGKTNLIEAIWLFTGAKSFRRAKESSLIRFGEESLKLSISFMREEREQNAMMYLPRKGKKKVQLNYVDLPRQSALAGEVYAVVFSPVHLSLAEGGPELRRRFLDTAICQLMPRYVDILGRYTRVLRQRNALLKDLRRDRGYPPPGTGEMLDIFDETLARLAVSVIRARRKYTERLEKAAGSIYQGISSQRETLSLKYQMGAVQDDDLSSQNIQNQLKQSRPADIAASATLIGPHRDDLALFINGIDVRDFGSQGQKRSCVLSLKLAESIIIEEATNQRPIVLLDDVMSELDPSRRDYILNSLTGKQVFITCCDTAYFRSLENGKCFHIAGGKLEGSVLEFGKGEW